MAQVKGVERRLQKRGEEIDRLRDEKDQLVSTSPNLYPEYVYRQGDGGAGVTRSLLWLLVKPLSLYTAVIV